MVTLQLRNDFNSSFSWRCTHLPLRLIFAAMLTATFVPTQAAHLAATAPTASAVDGGASVLSSVTSDCLLQVALGFLAQRRGAAATKAYGQRMIASHEIWAKELRLMGYAKGLRLPNSLSEAQRRMLDELAKSPDDDFDHGYLQVVERTHLQVLELVERESRQDHGSPMGVWAARVVEELRQQLTQARELELNSNRAYKAATQA